MVVASGAMEIGLVPRWYEDNELSKMVVDDMVASGGWMIRVYRLGMDKMMTWQPLVGQLF